MTRVGQKQIVHTESLILPKEEHGVFSFIVDNWRINIDISFFDSPGDEKSQEINIIPTVNGGVALSFKNWSSSLGTATTEPSKLAKTENGRDLYFMVTQWRVGNVNKVDIQFMV